MSSPSKSAQESLQLTKDDELHEPGEPVQKSTSIRLADGLSPSARSASSPFPSPTRPFSTIDHQREASAYLSWVKAVLSHRSSELSSPEQLADGSTLFDILTSVDQSHFLNPHAQTTEGSGTNYAVKLGTLKRLYKLVIQYYSETLLLSPAPELADVDLNEVATSSSLKELCKLCKLVIGVTVQSDRTKADHILAIQTLSEQDQQSLMLAIEEIMIGQSSLITPPASATLRPPSDGVEAMEVERLRAEKANIEKLYLAIIQEHQTLKVGLEEAQNEKTELAKELEILRAGEERIRVAEADVVLRGEVEDLRVRLRTSEDRVAEYELEVEKLRGMDRESVKKLADLQPKADEATRLKDELDEHRHLADRVQRTENANEKYRKKLEETAGIRRQLKDLEKENSELLQRNVSLENDCAKALEYKPLVDKYRKQIETLSERNGVSVEEIATLRYNLEQTSLQIKSLEEARRRDTEELELYRDKVEELELGVNGNVRRPQNTQLAAEVDGPDGSPVGELNDALAGTTMADLKLRVYQLSRDLKAARQVNPDNSRILVLENLLEDNERMRKKYEEDYWREHRQRLTLGGELEKIRKGEGASDVGGEAATALRLQLAELTTEQNKLKTEHLELSVRNETIEKELAVARADLILVDQDKLTILASLRSEVKKEKEVLNEQVTNLRQEVRSAEEKEKTLNSQIQALLMDKVTLLESSHTREGKEALVSSSSSSSSSSIPSRPSDHVEEDQEKLQEVSASNKELQRRLEDLDEKMRKAKSFIRQQDRLLQEARKSASEQQQTYDSKGQDDQLKEEEQAREVDRLRRQVKLLKEEQSLMLSAFHHLSTSHVRTSLLSSSLSTIMPSGVGTTYGNNHGAGDGGGVRMDTLRMEANTNPPVPKSWLGQQQRNRTGMEWVVGRRGKS